MTILVVSFLLAGCVADDGDGGGPGGPADAFTESELNTLVSDWNADMGQEVSADMSAIYDANSDRGTWGRFGIFMGVSASVTLAVSGTAGCDYVWDVADHEFTSTCFVGTGASSAIAGVGFSGAVGYAFNFVEGAHNWYGRFVGTTISASLPLDLVSAGVGGFASPNDPCPALPWQAGGSINWNTGVYGVQVELGVGVSVNPSPVGFNNMDGLWVPNPAMVDAARSLFSSGPFPVAESSMTPRTTRFYLPNLVNCRQQVAYDQAVIDFTSAGAFVRAFCKFTGGQCFTNPIYYPVFLAYAY